MFIAILIVALALVTVGVVQARANVFLVQYLFFLRYPILLALALTAGPVCAVTAGRYWVGNLFVLDGNDVGVVMAVSVFAAGTILYTFNLIFAFTYARTGLPFFRRRHGPDANLERQKGWAAALGRAHSWMSMALVAPLGAVLVVESSRGWVCAALQVAIGVGVSVLMGRALTSEIRVRAEQGMAATDWVAARLGLYLRRSTGWTARHSGPFARPRQWLVSTFKDGFQQGQSWLGRALFFGTASFFVYGVGYFALRLEMRDGRPLASIVPVLVYLLLILIVFGWTLAFLSFYLDKFRIPALLPLILSWALSYGCEADHYFPLNKEPDVAHCSLTPDRTVKSWLARNRRATGKPTMILVAASGGGIAASQWTARVLTGLARRDALGSDFARSIALVSSASGGGVGAAYFVDAYAPDHELGDVELDRILAAAGESSLPETAYAIAYHDILRVLVPFAAADSHDRGWALEHAWGRRFSHPAVSLRDWRRGVEEGWRPTQIFNVTMAETGGPLLLGSFDCPTGTCAGDDGGSLGGGRGWRAKSLSDLYGGGCAVNVVTAARLSATFPWVTPLSRAPRSFASGWHMADGGYYDNFGIVSTIQWLSHVQEKQPLADVVDKVLLVQVRATADEGDGAGSPAQADSGWVYASLGPLLTLSNARTTSQRNRNEEELLDLKSHFAEQRVAFESVDFTLEYKAPLSWHLSQAEKNGIIGAWDGAVTRRNREHLKCLWATSPPLWPSQCSTQRPIQINATNGLTTLFRQAKEESERPVQKPVTAR